MAQPKLRVPLSTLEVVDAVPLADLEVEDGAEPESEPVADFKTTTVADPGVLEQMARGAVDWQTGLAKEAGQLVTNLARVPHAVPGFTAATDYLIGQPGMSMRVLDQADAFLQPTNTTQRVAKTAAQMAETVIPGRMVTKAGVALASRLPRGLQTLGQMAVEGAGAAGMAGAQGSDPTVAGGVGAALVPGGKLAGAVAPTVAPAMSEALALAQRRGIPVDFATATGSRIIRTVQDLIGRGTVGGALVRDRAQDASEAALARTGRALAEEAAPAAVVKEQAGQGMRDTVADVITHEYDAANAAYDTLRAIEARPSSMQTVKVGTRKVETGVLRADGTPVTRMEVLTKDVPLPVDMRPVKEALRPILAEWEHTIPQAERNASPGLLAVKNLVSGEDVVPATAADKSLGAIKDMARGADLPQLRNISQGIAAKATAHLEDAVRAAVAQGGPEATAALQAGRAATVAKYGAAAALKKLREEPVQAFGQAVYANDAGIKHLREVATLAPQEMPKVGRAFIEDLMTKATAKGGFGREEGLFQAWQHLGPETKKLLFPNTMHRRDLDAFFLLASKAAENSNKSGSGFTAALGAQGYQAMVDPLSAAGVQLSAAAMAKLLYSPRGVRLLTQGLKLPTLDKSTAATVLEQLRRAATSPAAAPSTPAPARREAAR